MLEALTGTGLAVSAGLNAYIPLLVVGFLDRYTALIDLPSQWTWLTRPWTLAALTLLLIIEIVADKVPVLDHVNDVIQTVVRPTAGGLSFGAAASAHTVQSDQPSAFFYEHSWLPVLAGLFIGLAVHTAKAALRPVINLSTFGLGTPLISTAEDGFSLGMSIVAIVIPALVLVMTVAVVVFFLVVWRRRMGGRTHPIRHK